jgi:CO/xanthine dehydrogenase Mo-binding subunit
LAAILRSPYGHANIKSIDTSIARSMPSVVDVLIGADVPCNPLPMAWPAGGSAGIQNNVNPLAPLGIKHLDMPLSAARIWAARQSNGKGASA